MKTIWFAAAVILMAGMAKAADLIYVKIQGEAPAILSNGREFAADKGDCFPFVGYDSTQTLIQLKFGALTFWTRKDNTDFVSAEETADAVANYQADLTKARAALEEPGAFPSIATLLDMVVNGHTVPAPVQATAKEVVRQLQGPLQRMIREELSIALAGKGGDRPVDSFPVDAKDPAWQNSGVWVKAGQHVLVQADEKDRWDIGWGPTDAGGYSYQHDPVIAVPQFHTGKPNEDWHWGALICAEGENRIEAADPSHQVEVGSKRGFTVDRDGFLYFICNDDAMPPPGKPGYGDNAGIVHVKVMVTDPASQPVFRSDSEASQPASVAPDASLATPHANPVPSPIEVDAQ
jgi:hypothetical protein